MRVDLVGKKPRSFVAMRVWVPKIWSPDTDSTGERSLFNDCANSLNAGRN